uniref:Protein SYS1 homolog n=1 Tax=Timspurckia oligopyrenoides TaxID=708627 RepID=A0A7S0ZK56_9RHOD|mmetsp:Transcript_8451/g.15299  ORF Transcript_8451/g.15299 Transcript_8451/m.15299 type:complete len:210 (+) Transcript_8451:83-712(+)
MFESARGVVNRRSGVTNAGSSTAAVSGGDGAFYGRESFNPWLILFHIVLLQFCFYISYSILLFTLNRMGGIQSSVVEQMFQPVLLTFSTIPGWFTICSFVLCSIGPYLTALVFFIRRAKKCLDYTVTLYIIHFVACTSYSGRIPTHWAWWFVIILTATIVSLSAEFLCLRLFDMREISLNTTQNNSKESSTSNSNAAKPTQASAPDENV